jgi:hypothetical protein
MDINDFLEIAGRFFDMKHPTFCEDYIEETELCKICEDYNQENELWKICEDFFEQIRPQV